MRKFAEKAGMKQQTATYGLLLRWIIIAALSFFCFPAQGQNWTRTVLRHNHALHIMNASEAWVDEWRVTDTFLRFPGGGKAGFYRRTIPAGQMVPPNGREGVLYLYPENPCRPVRISRNNITITPKTAFLTIGAAANRIPSGKWILKIVINGRQFGQDLTISGQNKWHDFAFDLHSFIGRKVDIDIEANSSNKRAPYIYIDYIRLENPTHPAKMMIIEPAAEGISTTNPPSEGIPCFDDSYLWFLELLNQREDRRQQNIMDQCGYFRYPGKP